MMPQPDDTRWSMVLDPGPDCRCSRCHAPILDPENPLRFWSKRVSGEYRYHWACLGLHITEDEEASA